jgi:hypothetical protein
VLYVDHYSLCTLVAAESSPSLCDVSSDRPLAETRPATAIAAGAAAVVVSTTDSVDVSCLLSFLWSAVSGLAMTSAALGTVAAGVAAAMTAVALKRTRAAGAVCGLLLPLL